MILKIYKKEALEIFLEEDIPLYLKSVIAISKNYKQTNKNVMIIKEFINYSILEHYTL